MSLLYPLSLAVTSVFKKETDLFQFLKIAKRETSLVLGLENFEEQVLSSILVSKI